MRQQFSRLWVGSSQVRKQRKYRYNAPLHVKNTFLNAQLSKELRAKHNQRSATIRKGDEVLVMRGSFARKKAKIIMVDNAHSRVTLEGLTRDKRDGSKRQVFFRPHVLQIVALGSDDKKRFKRTMKTKEKTHAPHTK